MKNLRHKKRKLLFLFALIVLLTAFWMPDSSSHKIKYIERSSDKVKVEEVAGEKWLIWLYNNPVGRLSTKAIVKRKFVSGWYGKMMDSPKSQEKISSFISTYDIDTSIAIMEDFSNFNEFFIRKLKKSARPIDAMENSVASPADGKVLAWENLDESDFIVKGYKFNLSEYLQDDELAKKFAGGSMMLFRLCPTDYHRFHFPVSGVVEENKKIDGDYYSVSPIAIKKIVELFCLNKRELTLIGTKDFGDIIMSEIGATMVGSIINTYVGDTVAKGQEKGYFKFGGSSVLLIFEKGKVTIDRDILENTKKGFETKIFMGERVAIGKE